MKRRASTLSKWKLSPRTRLALPPIPRPFARRRWSSARQWSLALTARIRGRRSQTRGTSVIVAPRLLSHSIYYLLSKAGMRLGDARIMQVESHNDAHLGEIFETLHCGARGSPDRGENDGCVHERESHQPPVPIRHACPTISSHVCCEDSLGKRLHELMPLWSQDLTTLQYLRSSGLRWSSHRQR